MKLDGFIGPSYTLGLLSAGAQRTVNLYLEAFETGPRKQNVARLVGTPGLTLRATLGNGQLRGVHRASTGQLFVVSNSTVYEVDSSWTATARTGTLATNAGRVTMADNGTTLEIGDGTTTGYQVALAAGSAVSAVAADCPGGHVTWQDGYFVRTKPSTGQFQISGLNADTWDALDVATAEGRPDNLVMVLSVNRMLWLFGEQTTEVWYNSGDADFPFARNQSAFLDTGTVSAGTCVRANGSVAWVGNDEHGQGTVWAAQGYEAVRISTHAVELALGGYKRLSEASAFSYQQNGHEFYQLSVPASDTDPGGTWVYDFSAPPGWGWHERTWLGPAGEEPHRAWVGCVAFGHVVVGDRENGKLYTYDLNVYEDAGQPIRRLRQTAHVSQDEKRIRFSSFELQAEVGVGLSTGQGEAPIVVLQWSPDGGHTWSNEHEASLGAIGAYRNRAIWRRLGVGRDWVFRVVCSEPVPISWLGADVSPVQLNA